MAQPIITQVEATTVEDSAGCRARRLIVMTRIPEPGRVKTRLIPVLGAEGAAALHEALLRRSLHNVHLHSGESAVDVEIRFTGGSPTSVEAFSKSLGGMWREQRGEDLGRRMQIAIEDAFSEGVRQVVMIGTDCPDLSPEILNDAWMQLDQSDVVLGPATDGGYYLVGVNQPDGRIFLGIDWGTENVLRQTMERCREMRVSVGLLAPLTDIDEAENLVICRRAGADLATCLPHEQSGLLSVIIPTLNERDQLEETVGPIAMHPKCEVIIADGGSSDGTVELAKKLGCRVVMANRGRGRQMNAGAAMARGQHLLFLHADTRVPPTFVEDIDATLCEGVIAGAFRLRVEQAGWQLRCVEWGANLRSRLRQKPYGDQGLFLRSSDFFRIGGFQNWPLMEDYELTQRLRRHGRIALASSAARTSARRWMALGVFRTTLTNQLCITGYHLGVSPERLARWYASIRRSKVGRPQSGTRWKWLMLAMAVCMLLVGAWIMKAARPTRSTSTVQNGTWFLLTSCP